MTAVQLQMEYLELARKYVEDKYGADVDEVTSDVLDRWESVLTRLADDPMQLARELDWVAKLEILEGYRRQGRAGLGPPRLQLVDLQYSDVRPERGLYNRLVGRGRMTRLVDRGRRRARRWTSRRRTPGPTSAAAACASTRRRSRRRPGTRSSSTSRPRVAAARADAGAAARHQGARRRPAGQLRDRRELVAALTGQIASHRYYRNGPDRRRLAPVPVCLSWPRVVSS